MVNLATYNEIPLRGFVSTPRVQDYFSKIRLTMCWRRHQWNFDDHTCFVCAGIEATVRQCSFRVAIRVLIGSCDRAAEHDLIRSNQPEPLRRSRAQ